MGDINLEIFKGLYFEESEEGLERLECLLVQLEPGIPDAEKINDVFRIVHSLKGGGATFGFQHLVELAHILETYLDLIRKQVLVLTAEGLDILIAGLDKLQLLLKQYKDPQHAILVETGPLIARVEKLIQQAASPPPLARSGTAPSETASNRMEPTTYQLVFRPHPDLFLTGNDPIRFLRELDRMGPIQISTHVDQLPPLANMVLDQSYFSYTVRLNTAETETQIRDIFSWIEDQCELVISRIAPEEPLTGHQPDRKTKNTEEVKNFQDEKTSIRVHVDKIDQLLNTVGELVIIESMLNQVVQKLRIDQNVIKLQEGLQILEQTIRDLQESVMRIRMVPINHVFSRVPRIIYDLSKRLGKEVVLKIFGEQTELDKTVLEKLGDPLVHLVRNALDHGIESPEERLKNNKPAKGVLKLAASHHSGSILIEITDDGRGIDKQKVIQKATALGLINPAAEEITEQRIYQLLFEPGFSTADKVSEVSGRGVGMDVVKRNIQSLGGYIGVKSKPGVGTTFTIQLPLTLAILDGQLVRIGQETFIIPLVNICETVQVSAQHLKTISGQQLVYQFRNEFIPVLMLHHTLGHTPDITGVWDEKLLIVVEEGHMKIGITVDELLNQQQVVIKTLEGNFKKLKGISGATILGDGTVSLILDVPELVNF